jgi:hypothetical protein
MMLQQQTSRQSALLAASRCTRDTIRQLQNPGCLLPLVARETAQSTAGCTAAAVCSAHTQHALLIKINCYNSFYFLNKEPMHQIF